jgi:hypothetical protein
VWDCNKCDLRMTLNNLNIFIPRSRNPSFALRSALLFRVNLVSTARMIKLAKGTGSFPLTLFRLGKPRLAKTQSISQLSLVSRRNLSAFAEGRRWSWCVRPNHLGSKLIEGSHLLSLFRNGISDSINTLQAPVWSLPSWRNGSIILSLCHNETMDSIHHYSRNHAAFNCAIKNSIHHLPWSIFWLWTEEMKFYMYENRSEAHNRPPCTCKKSQPPEFILR